jgi:hypothetical protein
MARQYFNRYQYSLINGEYKVVPYINLPSKPTDQFFIYKVGKSRLDKISQEFYGSPYFGWLIMLANPKYGGLENFINDGAIVTVPFPLVASLQDYKAALDNQALYYGQ